jgi:SAM-dependent methyltransferase
MGFDDYFDKRSGRFSAFYGKELATRALGRGALFDRLRFAVEKAVEGKAGTVLDVGCGSGPLFEPLASRGIAVTGLEPAPSMLELARAQAARFPGLVEVRQGSWTDIDERDAYDLAVGLGLFDYVEQAGELLTRMGTAARAVVASFPGPGVRTEFRKVRYRRGGVQVYGYERPRILELAAVAGLEVSELRPLGRAGYAAYFVRPGG